MNISVSEQVKICQFSYSLITSHSLPNANYCPERYDCHFHVCLYYIVITLAHSPTLLIS